MLELEGKDIGIVTGIQGIRWFEVTVRGEDRHSGTTPMGAAQECASRRRAAGRARQ